MLNLVEMAAKIVLEHGAVGKDPDTIVDEIKRVYTSLKLMEEPVLVKSSEPPVVQEDEEYLTVEEAFGKTEIKCLVCGHGGMKVLKQHLTREHHITPDEYRMQFGLPKHIPLVSNEYHEERRASAIARGLGKQKRAVMNPQRQPVAKGFQTKTGGTGGFQTKTGGTTGGFIIRKKQLNAAK